MNNGLNQKKRRYDLPLHRNEDGYFLVWIIGFMFFLVSLALWANFALSSLSQNWRQGLTGQLTIEIPPEFAQHEKSGISITNQESLDQHVQNVLESLKTIPGIISAQKLSAQETENLIKPWLGDLSSADLIPIPTLIDVKLSPSHKIHIPTLEKTLQNKVPNLRIDDHSEWLQDLLSLIRTMSVVSFILIGIILSTTLAMIAASAKSRMALLNEEIDLLHLIGASDNYISKQMQKYIFFNTLKGAAWGTGLAATLIALLHFAWSQNSTALLPNIHPPVHSWVLLFLLPLIGSAMATLIARYTVMRSLMKIF